MAKTKTTATVVSTQVQTLRWAWSDRGPVHVWAQLTPVQLGSQRLCQAVVPPAVWPLLQPGQPVQVQWAPGQNPTVLAPVPAVGPTEGKPLADRPCPACGQPLVQQETGWYCVASPCQAQREADLWHFFNTFNPLSVSHAVFSQLCQAGGWQTERDIFTADGRWIRQQVGDQAAEQVMAMRYACETIPLPYVLTSLQVAGFSYARALTLAEGVPGLAWLREASLDQLMALRGIGPATAMRLHQAMQHNTVRLSRLALHATR